jgi:hypothetical protein
MYTRNVLTETEIHEMDTWASPENMISLKLVASQGSQSRVGPQTKARTMVCKD